MTVKQDFRAFYFKTKIVIVDDNELFLKTMDYKLSRRYQVDSFSNPAQALDRITSNYNENLVLNEIDFVIEAADEEIDDHYYSVEFSNIKCLVENPERANIITVLIVDYSMPLMNGVEFCEKIAHLPILKIMLTGQADFNIAIDAFNRGIIDRFLIKDSSNMFETIIESIDAMQQTFFIRQSLPLLTCLTANKKTLINSNEYNNHLRGILKELNAVEYYMLDVLGSYLIVSEHGQHHYFIVLLDGQLESLIDVAKNSRVPPELLKKIENKTHAPIFLEEEDYKLSALKWDNLLKPITKMNLYYYCLIPQNNTDTLALSAI